MDGIKLRDMVQGDASKRILEQAKGKLRYMKAGRDGQSFVQILKRERALF